MADLLSLKDMEIIVEGFVFSRGDRGVTVVVGAWTREMKSQARRGSRP